MRQDGLLKQQKENKILAGHGKSERRVEQIRRAREDDGMAREIWQEQAHLRAKQIE